MSDEFPRRKGRPPRQSVFAAQEEAEITASGEGYASVEDIPGSAAYRTLSPSDTMEVPSGEYLVAAQDIAVTPPTWELIGEGTPRDGYEMAVRYGDDDDALVRRARWKLGRRFNGRRWEDGGTWVPVDGMTPLPAEPPTHWLKPPAPPEAERGAEEAA